MNDLERAVATLKKSAAEVAGSIEEVFETTSVSVFERLSEMRTMTQAISQIREATSVEQLGVLSGTVSEAVTYLDRIGGQYAFLENVSEKLRDHAQQIDHLLQTQDGNMRLASMIAMNAQVVSSSIPGADGSISAFADQVKPIVGRATDAARAVDGDLQQADVQLESVKARIDDLCATVRDLTACRHAVWALTSAFSDHAGLEALLKRVLDAGTQLNTNLNDVVAQLQCGDASRQRLEHVEAMLDRGLSCDRATQAVIFRIAAAQFDATTAELRAAVEHSLPKLAAISTLIDRARDSVAELAQAKIVASLDRAARNIRFISTGIGQVTAKKDSLAPRMENLTELYRIGASSTDKLSEFDEAMLYLGINATLVSSKLGGKGRAMVEVSQQLRDCTIEVRDCNTKIVQYAKLQELNAILFSTIANIDESSQAVAMVDGLEAAHRTISEGISSLEECVSRDGNDSFAMARDRLLGFGQERALSVILPSFDLDAAPEAEALAPILDEIRGLYTMQAEREVHDEVLRQINLERPDFDVWAAA